MENVIEHTDIKVFTTKGRRNYLLPETNYHTTDFCTETSLAIEMKKCRYL